MNEEIKNNSVFECYICNNYKKGEFIVIEDKKYHLCCITNLQQENSQLKKKYENAVSDYELEKYKNSKAIEYIENDLQSFLYSIEYKTLLEILKGGNK